MPSAIRGIVQRMLFVVLALGLLGTLGAAAPLSGEAPLDNNPENERQTYRAIENMAPGEIQSIDSDGDGDFDVLEFGIQGGGTVYGWSDMDSDPREAELIVVDPTLTADSIRTGDADNDDDPEVIWVGARGADFDGDGEHTLAEAGDIIGLADVDGDGPEIILQDTSRELTDFHKGSFSASIDVLWVGILSQGKRGRAATVLGLKDVNDDGEPEVELKNISTNSSQHFDRFLDIDGDGDGDIVIRLPDTADVVD